MNRKIQNWFLANYVLMFILSIMVIGSTLLLLSFANYMVGETLVKNHYTAASLMRDDYRQIETAEVIANGGGVQVINRDYEVVLSAGLDAIGKERLSVQEFTDFLTANRAVGTPFSHSIEYDPDGGFWLVVTFPTSIRIDFAVVRNREFGSVDTESVMTVIVSVVLFSLLLLAISTVIYSRLSSFGVIRPLQELSRSAQRLRDGDYSARVDLKLQNEFAQLQETFNDMAERIEQEIALRKQSEENRKRLVLDISHDLKNPLAVVMGYAEYCRQNPDLNQADRDSYLATIYENSVRANRLITGLFELSKVESAGFVLDQARVDICEYLREEMGAAIPIFERAGFAYDFDIPDREIYVLIDRIQMSRVFQNLVDNALRYNPKGTMVTLKLIELDSQVTISLKDDGAGIHPELAKDIFQPFVRADEARNSQTGGTGLGLAIAERIIAAHGGKIDLITDLGSGCEFVISLPTI